MVESLTRDEELHVPSQITLGYVIYIYIIVAVYYYGLYMAEARVVWCMGEGE